jgi:hypothetical protein
MSSAILYLAIVAIWACVLIPRWLRRDSARGAATPAPADSPVMADPLLKAEPPGTAGGPVPAEPEAAAEDDPADEADMDDAADAAEPAPLNGPERAADSRRRMLAARRRLLLMLIGLEIAAIVLALVGLAAVWVVVPPTLMLTGYLLLLREAAQADAEYGQRAAEAAERARLRRRERTAAPPLPAQHDTPAEGTSTEGVAAAAAALAAKFAAAPIPADYEDGPGRDFAPGLAGKYTTSNAETELDEDYYPRLRAVGD